MKIRQTSFVRFSLPQPLTAEPQGLSCSLERLDQVRARLPHAGLAIATVLQHLLAEMISLEGLELN
ncbi:hypothetical protein DAA51_38205 [Bradyrhizobium sp. WBAH10]|nr:hypothetical protein [Bradyrhizobium sp. WBAH30]MDD1547586.1 hypothetical protein [Bradyrhizobium sp. WBAH41]MDD1561221.1 hypothetical protein [Bradyrhizobium sp. WBAH23]MDD1568702.1 hypothetical protein [Bradyrhizobium sp. WBAH33]MDD1594677.1 hypothetical protein [Bradyrhizobium sp. WBAH42]NRB92177.1 hypothetical protein [Bradyrhizobium sp. WBAH10]QCJ93620.1 hypothetical protein DAA57_38520 [Bradyrhizobium yuanmingense]